MAELQDGQGHIGDRAPGLLELEDDDPRTEGATFDTVNYEVEDDSIASVTQDAANPLQCWVTIGGIGQTQVLVHVDPGEGELLHFSAPVEGVELKPGEASTGTFTLGKFVPQAPQKVGKKGK